MSIQKTVKTRMKSTGITQKQIAQHVLLSEDQINSWLSEKTFLPYILVWQVYDLLQLDQEDLLNLMRI